MKVRMISFKESVKVGHSEEGAVKDEKHNIEVDFKTRFVRVSHKKPSGETDSYVSHVPFENVKYIQLFNEDEAIAKG